LTIKDLIPRNRGTNVATRRSEDANPFMMLQREMNRMFDDVFRSFDLAPFGTAGSFGRAMSWPNIELSETGNEVKVVAELPGLDENDVQVELVNGVLVIKGEKKTEAEDKDLMFSERYYGRFERRIPIEDVDESKIGAAFKNGVLTVIMPKSPKAQEKVKRIAINAN